MSPPQYNGHVQVHPSPPQMQQPIQQTTGQPIQQPMQHPMQQPMQQPIQQPIQQPSVQPTQQHIGQPIVIEHQHPLAATPQHLHRGVSQGERLTNAQSLIKYLCTFTIYSIYCTVP